MSAVAQTAPCRCATCHATRAAVQVANVVSAHRFRYASEARLQEGLAVALTQAGYNVRREVRLDARSRVDLIVEPHRRLERVGVEVKVAGSRASVLRQVTRYLQSDEIDALVLVTSRVRHTFAPIVAGKPLVVVQLAGAGL